MLQHNHENNVLADAHHLFVDVAAQQQLEYVAHHYGITPVFVGLFGSRAKGYHGPKSDFDLYVPYVGKLGQYVRALDMDTRQLEGEPILPPQITIEVVGADHQTYSVQLNFLSLDHYIQELSRNNIDFRIALDNILLTYCDTEFITLLGHFSASSVDLENIRSKALGRASKTAALLKRSDLGRIKPSEVTDGLYRLLMAAWAVTERAVPHIYCNHTQPIEYLLSNYMFNVQMDEQASLTVRGVLEDVHSGVWSSTYVQWAPKVVELIDKLIPIIRARPLPGTPDRFNLSVEAKFGVIALVNQMYQKLVLKAHLSRSLL